MKKKKFQDWVYEYGGLEKLAYELGMAFTSVNAWVNSQRTPRIPVIFKIIELSNGELDLESIVRDTLPEGTVIKPSRKKKARTRPKKV